MWETHITGNSDPSDSAGADIASELMDGDWVDVVVSSTSATAQSATSLLVFIDSLPPGPRAASDWNEFEPQLREDRESWDR